MEEYETIESISYVDVALVLAPGAVGCHPGMGAWGPSARKERRYIHIVIAAE